jgi:N-acetylneuraminate lyase
MNISDFRLIAAPFTPMHSDGSLNLEVVRDQINHLISHGVPGAFVGGTTGEGQSLTVAERESLAEAWAGDEQCSKLELIIHVGHNSQQDAIRLASHAQSLGADAIAMHSPIWFKPQNVDDLIEFCVPIAAAAAKLPFYFYDIPKITGVNLSSAKFLANAKQRIPNLAGIKYTNPDCATFLECVQLNDGEYDVLWGCDEALLAAVALGAKGAVGSTYNVAAPLYLRVLEAAAAGDWETARAEQARSVAMVRICEQFTALAAFKYIMKLVGVDCGPVRWPVRNLTEAEQRKLRDDLEGIGFFSDIAVPRQMRGSAKTTLSEAASR